MPKKTYSLTTADAARGGRKSAANMSPEERRERARAAAKARWESWDPKTYGDLLAAPEQKGLRWLRRHLPQRGDSFRRGALAKLRRAVLIDGKLRPDEQIDVERLR